MTAKHSSAHLEILQEQLSNDEAARQRLLGHLATVQKTITTAEDEIKAARLHERVLLAQIDQKDRAIDAQRRMVSPVARLSDDILAEIFALAPVFFSRDLKSALNTAHQSRIGFCIAAVNSRWRTVALACPGLWSWIWVDFPGKYLSSYSFLSRLSAQLQRSRQAPLTVMLDEFDSERLNEPAYRIALEKVLSAAPRWRSVLINVSSYGLGDQCIISHLRSPTPLLEKFVLYDAEASDDFEEEECSPGEVIKMLPNAPRLRTLVIGACILPYIPKLACESLVKLTIKRGGCPPTATLADALSALPSLEELTISFWSAWEASDPSISLPTVTLPNLSKLTFEACTAADLGLYTLCFAFPKLTHLELRSYKNAPADHMFIQSSCPALRTLVVACDRTGQALTLMQNLPKSVSSITLRRFHLGHDDFLPFVDDSTFCPQLEILDVSTCTFIAEDTAASALLSFARSRSAHNPDRTVKLLSTIVVAGADDVPCWLSPALMELQEHSAPTCD